MSGQLPKLFAAILANEEDQAKALLKADPGLARLSTAKASLEETITHWIYAGDTALHVAAAGHRVAMTSMLLAAGADPGANFNHRRGQPLHYAADGYIVSPLWSPERQVAVIRLLLDAGADLHAQDKNGATPLHRAVRTRCAAAVHCLLEAGADATLQNEPGSTPFHLAVQNTGRGGSGAEPAKQAQRDIIQAFLDRGVSPRLKDAQGRSVLEWAKSDWVRELLV